MSQTPIPTLKKDSCDRDTILIMPQGLEVRMGICDYYKKKDYFDVQPTVSFEALKTSNLTTYDDKGNPLITGGMLLFKNHPTDTCFDKPVVFRLKLDTCSVQQNFQLWDIQPNGTWKEDKTTAVRKIKIGKDVYIEFKLKCIQNGRAKNLDLNRCSKKIAFHAETGYKITELRFVSRCNNFAANVVNALPKSSVSFWVPCPIGAEYNQYVKAKVVNKKGEIFDMDFKQVALLPKKRTIHLIAYCKGHIRVSKKCSSLTEGRTRSKFLLGRIKEITHKMPILFFKKAMN
jgi:hypothetical protein